MEIGGGSSFDSISFCFIICPLYMGVSFSFFFLPEEIFCGKKAYCQRLKMPELLFSGVIVKVLGAYLQSVGLSLQRGCFLAKKLEHGTISKSSL